MTRRGILATLLAGAGTAALGDTGVLSPLPRPRPDRPADWDARAAGIVRAAGLSGDVSFVLADLSSGEVRAAMAPDLSQPPASTLKAVTALYALDHLGPEHRFATRLVADGRIENGRLEGDLVLVGGGDPALDTDHMAELAAALKPAGIYEVRGRFLIWDGALRRVPRIHGGQPPVAAYNPPVSGLNLNFNRVHFEWEKEREGYRVTMEARARRFSPAVSVATMEIVDEAGPVYTYTREDGIDRWTVARRALGTRGARWLPVRAPLAYAGEVFRTLARSNGIVLPKEARAEQLPAGREIARIESAPLTEVLEGMLRYSTNLTAEAVGQRAGAEIGGLPRTLYGSGARMGDWTAESFGVGTARFVDHSGLGYGSRITAADMVRILAGGDVAALHPILRPVTLDGVADGVQAVAKTGTHNFVSALAGYLDPAPGRRYAFAIFAADVARRDGVPPELRERPDGSVAYARRARRMQKELLVHWARTVTA